MQDQVFPSLWLQASSEARQKLAEVFGVGRSSHAEVATGPNGHVLVSDGRTAKDLMAITKEKMAEYSGLAATKDTYELFTACVEKAEYKEPEKPAEEAEKKFCEFCDSKGVKHKSDCTRPKV